MASGEQLDKILNVAAKKGMPAAIKLHGQALSRAEASVLTAMTNSELKQLQSLRDKLGPLQSAVADNNGGVF